MTAVAGGSEASKPSLSSLIPQHLPFLRRFGRALCGDQASGDAYVASTLEALIADRSALDTSLPPRVALYKLFHSIWSSAQVDPVADERDALEEEAKGSSAERRLSRLTPRHRQALLLTSVEEFSVEEAAMIMDIDTEEAEQLVKSARGELDEQMQSRVMIIEDEPIIALDIESIVRGLGHEVTGVADTHETAVALANETEPDLVLADIQLADGSSGVEAVEDILEKMEVPVIFVTAFPERLLTGERPEPTFLLTKPFKTETLEAAISQVLFLKGA
ncbi:MAG TPA: response regulator [Thermohalobaculum sp.]|nr:response regulator [Thermohalobaculum sp.]